MATALAVLTGERIVLAKAGAQGGIDGRSDGATLSISFEAKRYGVGRGLDDRMLLGELEELAQSADNRPEIWMIAATVSMSAQTRAKLSQSGRVKGIHVAVIDWNPVGLPSLLVLLASAQEEVLSWLDRFYPNHPTRSDVAALLTNIAENRSFFRERQKLVRELLPTYASFVSAKKAMDHAYLSGFKDRNEARRLFRQRLTPDAAGVVNLRRTDVLNRIREAAEAAVRDRGVAVVLGDEGTGKTWAAVETWREHFADAMCVLISSGHVESFQSGSAVYAIAHIIRSATKSYDINNKSWEVRVSVWQENPQPDRRLFVIIDGLNERPSVKWPTFISTIAQTVHQIGGTIVVTCRPRFWTSRVAGAFEEAAVEAHIGGLSPPEIAEFLSRHHRRLEDVPRNLLPSLINPRVLTVAVSLLEELGGSDLTMDRLYWSYWKHHWRERQDSVLSDEAFKEVLVNHARQAKIEIDNQGQAQLRNPRFLFSRWTEYAVAGGQETGMSIADVFWEVAEGRFLVPSEIGASEAYAFRKEALSFAIALRLVYEVLDNHAVLENESAVDEVFSQAIEPVEAFDRTAEILMAVVAIACLHPRSTLALQRASIRSFLGLQNRDTCLQSDFSAYVRQAPEAYLAVAAESIMNLEPPDAWLIRALQVGLDREESHNIISSTVQDWLLDGASDDELAEITHSWANALLDRDPE